ncbi:MAG: DNA-processing protein DprA [Fervidobacterium sp.]
MVTLIRRSEVVALSNLFKKKFDEIDEIVSYGSDDYLDFYSNDPAFGELVRRIEVRISKGDLNLYTYWDEEYPEALRNIPAPPVFIFVKGNSEFLSYDLFAIVGTRKMTNYGKLVTELFTQELSKHFVIVSGMAYGVDSIAHANCLKSSRPTIAVLGCGVDIIYPKQNENLYSEIIKRGCVISEYLPWEKPQKYTFVARNRIISGISKGILVTEAGLDSGALITAKFGIDQGKDIFSIPGDIFKPTSAGTNYLIRNGAFLVTDPSEILEYYGFKEHKRLIELNENEKILIELLTQNLTVDELAQRISKTIPEVLMMLTILEIKGLVYRLEDGTYMRSI